MPLQHGHGGHGSADGSGPASSGSGATPSSVRARLFDPTNGTFSTVSGSPFANTGTQNIATGGERVLVLDAA